MPSASRRKASSEKKQTKVTTPSKVATTVASTSASGTANGYHNSHGAFHVLMDATTSDGKGKTPDDTMSLEAASEYDSVSINGSCSGESEDQQSTKDKSFIPPGLEAPLEKQDKVRLKNEKKHQRQRERKAKELRERCDGFLMSNKLERLVDQIAPTGFPRETIRMALVLHDGNADQSINYILEGNGATAKNKRHGSLKLDIAEEHRRLSEMEAEFRYPRSEIEKAVVACEGDIDMARKWLKDHQPALDAARATTSRGGSPPALPQVQRPQPGTPKLPPSPRMVAWQRPSPMKQPPVLQERSPGGTGRPEVGLGFQRPLDQLQGGGDPRNFRQQHQQQHPMSPTSILKNQMEMLHLAKPEVVMQQRQQQHFHQQQHQHQHQQQPMAYPNPNNGGMWSNRPSPGTLNPQQQADDWNVKAFASVDYQAIDWSMGMSLNPCLRPASLCSPKTNNQHQQHLQQMREREQQFHQQQLHLQQMREREHQFQQMQHLQQLQQLQQMQQQQQQQHQSRRSPAAEAGFVDLDLFGPEWTSPFTGKELVQHQTVQSL